MQDEDLRAIRAAAAEIARDRYAPQAREWDEASLPLPDAERKFLAETGYLGITLPSEVGGSGRPLIEALIVMEELAKASPAAAWPVFEACTGPARVIDLFGSDEQKRRVLPPIVNGDMTLALSISEPDAGSAATDLRTNGVRVGDEIVVNGTKRWCSGAGHAERYLVYLRLGDGRGDIGAVLIDRDADGVSFGRRETLMGFRSVPSADIMLNDVRVPVSDVIVPAGGFKKLFEAFSIERLGNATMSLALAQSALDRTSRYVKERRQFSRVLADFQLVQATIADMVMRIEGARLLINRAAAEAGTRAPSALAASIAKCNANAMAIDVTTMALQLHGGYGYSAEYEIERLLRDAHGWAVAGGALNIQRIRIASEYLGLKFNQRA